MPTSSAQKFIKYSLGIGAMELVPEGRKLKSGRISPHFFNSGLFCTGDSIARLARAYYATIIDRDIHPEVLFGPAYKGISIATAVAQVMGGDIGYAYNRKEEKDHGEGGSIVGALITGKKVLITDDAMTTGESSGEAVEIIRAHGGIPIGCVIAFDRQERGKESALSAVQEFEKKFAIPVYAAATLDDLITVLGKEVTPTLLERTSREEIIEYRNRYGVDTQ